MPVLKIVTQRSLIHSLSDSYNDLTAQPGDYVAGAMVIGIVQFI